MTREVAASGSSKGRVNLEMANRDIPVTALLRVPNDLSNKNSEEDKSPVGVDTVRREQGGDETVATMKLGRKTLDADSEEPV